MQPPAFAPTAQGAFAKTPFPHLLVYALERRLTGTVELAQGGAPVGTILFAQGFPAKIRIAEQTLFLGDVMLEMGFLTRDQHGASIARLQESPRLHGQVLIEMGILDPGRVETAVRVQLERKLERLFALPPDAVFAYFDGVDALQRYGGPPTPIDPFPLLWRGIRQNPSWEHVDGTLRRVGSMALRITPHAQLERFLLGRGEVAALDLLRQRPMRVVDLANAKVVGPSVAQLLVYCLVITKQVDIVETASMRPPAGARNVPSAPPSSQPQPGGQAFARVQLQAKQVQRNPLIIAEEVSSGAMQSRDGRIATPPPTNADPGAADPPREPAPSMLDPTDIANMIMSSIGNSLPPDQVPMPMQPQGGMMPPAAAMPPMGSAPPGAPQSSPSLPAAGSSGQLPTAPDSQPQVGAPLSAEQTALRARILDRAEKITGQDYFQMLGVDPDAPPEAIQKAFFGLAKIWHPDRLPSALFEVKEACSKVFTHLTEAHATLSDPERRSDYMKLLKEGGATPDDQAKIQGIIEATQEFQKADFHLKRNENDKAYELVKRAYELDPDQMDYLAMLTWLEAQQPQWLSREKTLEKIYVLDRCIKVHPNGERAYFWRGMLFKRIEENSKAIKDLKKAMELNPRNLDAAREVRLYNMRGGSKAPPAGGSIRPGSGKGPPSDSLGGLFGKLFKK
jgi:hypothetical protein